MSTITESILSTAQSMPEGSMLSPKEFLHLGSRAAVDQAVTRLNKEGKLIRIDRGAYVIPIESRFGTRPPSTQAVIEAIETQQSEIVVTTGATSANVLGLTTQVPVREIFLTSGRSRKLKLGSRIIELKHSPRWQLALGKRPAGMAIRALSWLGPEQAHTALQILHTQLPTDEWNAMCQARSTLPSWMAKAVSEIHFRG